jgi:hypothetical protein
MTARRPPREGVSWPNSPKQGRPESEHLRARILGVRPIRRTGSYRHPRTEPSHVTEETTVRQAISLFLARARTADMHDRTRRNALAHTAIAG